MKHTELPCINLIPQTHTNNRWRTLWIHRWILYATIVTFVIGFPGIYIGASAAFTDSGMSAQIDQIKQENQKHQQAIPPLQKKIKHFSAEQEVFDLIQNRIDWRDVFSVLIDTAGNNIRFRKLNALGGGSDGTSPIQIEIEGLASSQTGVRNYVVKLEATKIFDTIELAATNRALFNDVELIRFKILITVTSHTMAAKESANAG